MSALWKCHWNTVDILRSQSVKLSELLVRRQSYHSTTAPLLINAQPPCIANNAESLAFSRRRLDDESGQRAKGYMSYS